MHFEYNLLVSTIYFTFLFQRFKSNTGAIVWLKNNNLEAEDSQSSRL